MLFFLASNFYIVILWLINWTSKIFTKFDLDSLNASEGEWKLRWISTRRNERRFRRETIVNFHMNNVEFSSNVNEVIRAVLNFLFFSRKNFTRTKSTKGTKSTKKHKMQISESVTLFLFACKRFVLLCVWNLSVNKEV